MLKIHRGKALFLSLEGLRLVDPVCRAETVRMHEADGNWARLIDHLKAAGPSSSASLQMELGLRPKELKAIRYPLERCGVCGVISSDAGSMETTVLLYEQMVREPLRACDPVSALADMLVAGVRAAVVAPERELSRWFSWSWYLPPGAIDQLVQTQRLRRLPGGLVALGPEPRLEGE